MLKTLRQLGLAVLLMAISAAAQNPQTAPPLSTSKLSFPVYTLNATSVPFASVNTVGATGQQQYCYWFVANFQIGSVMSSPFCVPNSANTLSGSNYNAIFPIYPAGVLNIDTLRTTSPFVAPSGACNCAVATGTTSGNVLDQSNSLNSYTVSLINISGFVLSLANEVTGAGVTHLMLRKADGTLVQDLSAITGGGGGGNPTLDNCAPDQTGNSFYSVASLTNYFYGHWEFVFGQAAYINCTVFIPTGPGVSKQIVLDIAANDATAGHTANFQTCDQVINSGTINAGALTCAANQTFTTTSTAYNRVTLTFAVQSTLSNNSILVVKIATSTTGTAPVANMLVYPHFIL
jgi:hypothetical protein